MGKAVKQWRSVSILASFSLVLTAPASAAPRDSLSMRRILVVGDSLSRGFGLKSSRPGQRFWRLLEPIAREVATEQAAARVQ